VVVAAVVQAQGVVFTRRRFLSPRFLRRRLLTPGLFFVKWFFLRLPFFWYDIARHIER